MRSGEYAAFLAPEYRSLLPWDGDTDWDAWTSQLLRQAETSPESVDAFEDDGTPTLVPESHLEDWLLRISIADAPHEGHGTVEIGAEDVECDWCSQRPQRYCWIGADGSAALCVECFRSTRETVLGRGRSHLLLQVGEIPEDVRRRVDTALIYLAEFPIFREVHQDSSASNEWVTRYQRFGFGSRDGHEGLRARIRGAQLSASRWGDVVNVRGLRLGHGGRSVSFDDMTLPHDLDRLEVGHWLNQLLRQVLDVRDAYVGPLFAISQREAEARTINNLQRQRYFEHFLDPRHLRFGRHLSLPANSFASIERVTAHLAATKTRSESLACRLALEHPDDAIRAVAAERSQARAALHTLLETEAEPSVRAAAIRNEYCEVDDLVAVARNTTSYLERRELAVRDWLPESAATALATSVLTRPSTRGAGDKAREVTKNEHGRLVMLVALRPDCPSELLNAMIDRVATSAELRPAMAAGANGLDEKRRGHIQTRLLAHGRPGRTTADTFMAVVQPGAQVDAERVEWIRRHPDARVRALAARYGTSCDTP